MSKNAIQDWDLVLDAPNQFFDGYKTVDGQNLMLAFSNDRIAYFGPRYSLEDFPQEQIIDCRGKIVTPGLIDCHTHTIFGGNRADEFSLRAAGASYEELLAQGGGIHNTVECTRSASFDELFHDAGKRLATMARFGVTTVEIKTGYGLDLKNELKMLRVLESLSTKQPLTCIGTCLAAHVLPKEYAENRSGYLDLIVNEIMPRFAESEVVSFVDVFVENNAFDLNDARRLFERAKALKLEVKMHAEQLSRLGSIPLAVEYDAASVDHLEYITSEDISLLEASNTVAVLLPSCNLYLKQSKRAPARQLLEARCSVALSTDCNPGSSMVENVLVAMSLGMMTLGMTSEEVWKSVTSQAAKALRLTDRGRLSAGLRADVVIFDCPTTVAVPYRLGSVQAEAVFVGGKLLP